MAAKNWQEFIDNYDGYLTSPEMQLIEDVWEAALKAVEENGSSHDKQSTPCNHEFFASDSKGWVTCMHCIAHYRITG